MSYWRDKTAIVTGGSAGFGKSLALALASRGANVVVAARNENHLAAAVSEMSRQVATADHRSAIVPCAADVTRDDDARRLVATTIERFGRVDALINNVGRSARGRMLDAAPDDLLDLLDVNLFAAVRCVRAAAPHLLATRGHIVNIGSLAAKCASRYIGAYAVSKFPLAAYSQTLRLEHAADQLHVLLVCPGPIARADADRRYAEQTSGLPAAARRPGGGVKLRALDPDRLAAAVLLACQRRQPELVVPAKARLLFSIAQLFPKFGDWMVTKMTGGGESEA